MRFARSPDVVLAICTGLLLGLVVRTVTNLMPARWRKNTIPFTASVLISGLVVGVVLIYGGSTDAISNGLDQLESISAVVLFAVFMPALITPSGLTLDFHQVKHTVVYSFALAIFGTMINATLITMVAKYVFPYSWEWSQAWLLGAILSATDPVAVVSIMESSGCDAKLSTVINGESLLNDGVAYVLFEVFLGWAGGEPVLASETVKFVFKAALGGPALGVAFALVVTLWFELLDGDSIAVVTVSLTAAYTLWTLSDVVLGVSAVLAVLFFASFIGLYGRTHIGGRAQSAFSAFWRWVDWVANTLIFFLAGLVISAEISNNSNDPRRYDITGKDWGMMFCLYFLLIPIRVVSVIILSPILRMGRYRMTFEDMVVLSYAGLRGAVGLTLSLIVYNSEEIADNQFKTLVFFFVGCVAVLTLLLQGTTTAWVLSLLGYTSVAPLKRHLQIQSAEMVDEMARVLIQKAKDRAADENFVLGRTDCDWERAAQLGSIDVVKLVKDRATTDKKAEGGGDASQGFTPHEHELLLSLRERLLRTVQSHYDDCARQGYLTPAEISILTGSVENASDAVDAPLDDWTQLKGQLDLTGLEGEVAGWKGKAQRAAAKVGKFLVRQRGPLSSLARRSPALVLTFILAHAEAQRELQLFVELEAESDEGADGAGADGAGAGAADQRDAEFSSTVSKLHRYEPYWDSEEFRMVGSMARGANAAKAAAVSRKASLVHHMTSNSLVLLEDVRRILRIVLQESTLEMQQAEELWEALKQARPDEIVAISTELLVIDVLRKQGRLLKFFVGLGILEEDEVGECLEVISVRQRGLRGDHL